MTFQYTDKNEKTLTATEQDSIERNIGTIASTPYGSAPFMRDMGIKNYPPENNSAVAKNLYATEVMTQCSLWEDRASVTEIAYEDEHNTRMVIEMDGDQR
jgi:phage baseplate assembly protein W